MLKPERSVSQSDADTMLEYLQCSLKQVPEKFVRERLIKLDIHIHT